MVKSDRILKIKELLLNQGQVNVNYLSKYLGVSEVTVRSYLEALETENFLHRIHGGAVLNKERLSLQRTIPQIHVDLQQEADKERIGQAASSMVEGEEWIFLGSGTTCTYIAKALLNREKLNVMTNNLSVASILTENVRANVVLTGGKMVHPHGFLSGEIFKKSMENVFISKAFIGAAGVDLKAGYTVSGMSEVSVNEIVKKISQEYIVVYDKKKCDTLSFMSVGDLDMADTVITNQDIPDKYKNYYKEHNIPVCYV